MYPGDRHGGDAGPGVYFPREMGQESRPVRIVKIR
jgi:hypothetical protein